jgi:hydrogenase-4 component F
MDVLILYYVSVVLMSVGMFLIRGKRKQHALFVPFLVLQLWFTIFCFQHNHQQVDQYFRIDNMAVIFLTVIFILSAATILHSVLFSWRRKETYRMIAVHDSALMLLVAAMCGVLVADHLALLWAFLEATTLASAMLIYRERSKKSFEAAWKYFFVCSIGIALAFVGILFVVIAGKEIGRPDINISTLVLSAESMNPLWLKIAFIFMVAGFSVKVGVVPLFMVDIDAKDAAPFHIGAIFSGAMTATGFVAIFRLYEIFAHTAMLQWANHVLLLMGLLSVLLATVYTMRIRNYKRLLAYSSVEHAGILLIGLAAGPIGQVAAVWHLISHSFIKSTLFYQLGNICWYYRTEDPAYMGGYYQKDMLGGSIFLLSALMILGFPPSGLFVSEYMLIKALYLSPDGWVVFPLLFLLAFMFANLSRRFVKLLFKPVDHPKAVRARTTFWEVLPQLVLLLLVCWLGTNPPASLVVFVEQSVVHLIP